MFEGGTRVPCVISWPGVTQPGSRSDAIVQSEDYYPTLLDGLRLAVARDQTFDGISLLPALRGESINRTGVVQFFPHSPSVPEWLPPAVSIHKDHWKLIRIFHGGPDGAHRYLLFDLLKDISEKNNVADLNPDVVKDLDDQISAFLQTTKAVVPISNPAFDPSKYHPENEGQPKQNRRSERTTNKTQTSSTNDEDPAMMGWKLRGLKALVHDGSLIVTEHSQNSFLGFSAGRHEGPTSFSFRIRSMPGDAHVDWLPDGPSGEARRIDWKKNNAEWEEICVTIPSTETLGIVRLYFPRGTAPCEVDWIQIESESGKITRSDF